MPASATAVPRTQVSLRLPVSLVRAVERYAQDQQVGKTEAYIHFLERGLSRDDGSLQRELRQISSMLRRAGLGEGVLAFDEVASIVAEVADQFPGISRAYVFGSYARGDQSSESDVDVRLVLDRSERFNLRDLAQFAKHVEQRTGREVDVVTAEKVADSSLAAAIEREKVLVYERETL